jgi:hypothetical protein
LMVAGRPSAWVGLPGAQGYAASEYAAEATVARLRTVVGAKLVKTVVKGVYPLVGSLRHEAGARELSPQICLSPRGFVSAHRLRGDDGQIQGVGSQGLVRSCSSG